MINGLEGGVLFYDSGLGGLNVVDALAPHLGDVSVTYVADNVMFPIGRFSEQHVRRRCMELIPDVVKRIMPELVIVACNTASTACLPQLSSVIDIPIFGTSPSVELAVSRSKTKVIALIATPSTVQRQELTDTIAASREHALVIPLGSIELVRLAQEKMFGGVVRRAAVESALLPLLEHCAIAEVDSLLLGCTHFDALVPELCSLFPRDDVVVTGSFENINPQIMPALRKLKPRLAPPLRNIVTTSSDDVSRLHRLFGMRGYQQLTLKGISNEVERTKETT